MNSISDKATIGANLTIGRFSIIEEGAVIGNNVTIGNYTVIHDGVEIGDNTVVKDYVELRAGTKIGANCYIDSRVSSSGNCTVEDDVVLRYDSIIARGCHIGKGSYICPRVMTNNLNTHNEAIGGAKVGKNVFVGTNSVLHYGITIGDDAVIGSMSFVNKDCDAKGTYIGIPAKKLEKKS